MSRQGTAPSGYKNASSAYGYEESILNASREQSEVCTLCLQNRRIKVDDLMARVLKKDPDFKEKVNEANIKCCATNDTKTRYQCRTFARIAKAYAYNIQSRGSTINACKCCPKYQDNDPYGHNHKPCSGKCEIKQTGDRIGKW